MKKIFFALAVIAIGIGVLLAYKVNQNDETKIVFTNTVSSSSYIEYAFDSGDDRDLGFTKRAYNQLQKAHTLLDDGSNVMETDEMAYSQLSERDMSDGIIVRSIWGDNTYELALKLDEGTSGMYQMSENGQPLFNVEMGFGAEGPIQDWRIVNGKPAFTVVVSCSTDNDGAETCTNDIWYDGDFMSKKFGVENPRYLFSYKDKIGFIASNNGSDAVFYDGKFITPGFDTIWTHNCCSYTEILPTVYENGTLLFYAIRETNYLVEAQLN